MIKLGGFKMTLEQAKQELVRRYKYLYENAYFILAPYMYEQSEEEFQNRNKEKALPKKIKAAS